MKIAFVDRYSLASGSYKDPISIPLALSERGHALTLVSTSGWQGELFGLPVSPLRQWEARLGVDVLPDVVVAITRFDPSLTSVLRNARAANCRIVVKGDTDGTVGYPLRPNYLRACPIGSNPINIARHLKWRLPLPWIIAPRVEQVGLSDALIVESPGAAANYSLFLKHWGHADKIDRLRFVPNPVAPEVLQSVPFEPKLKRIVSVGRWDDPVKGGGLLCDTIEATLQVRQDYSFLLIGPGSQSLRSKVRSRHLDRVMATGPLSFLDAHEFLRSARILLSTSLVESFSFVTAEALCAGATVVVPPIESLVYLSGGGAYGSIAPGFTSDAVSSALLREIAVWEQGWRDPSHIAAHWRAQLDPARIGAIWEEILLRND